MSTRTSKIAIAFSAALVATTAMAPLASAREWREVAHHDWRGGRGHDNTGAWLGLGIAALAGVAIAANVHPQPVYAPAPVYAQPAYVQSGPTCTTINGYAACLAPDGTWQYVR